ncbi:MAG: 30S ribosomal protein S11 [Candidatus Kerfeldbacteria bacterium CG15_BIG_FIL_POST_REV_8_21_14_020_45_12]|uniref:Small ribosomal subunit protein uS11 n=1 Tax=Candidatus Kerfeldbacteria bacterium CG15_BIG_FIL_POST_REV_8_21_14_020_45_12 TaxID=2014247 RepID=A0A2M7H5F4_9BACT|nr:MAG: 30S ribosomal protein S11 [Candidatus Kerfeldbacteria bacterium CG15_BIG_FIL_POST_REV_8_21_14_020_45_12]PJA93091.1 MAG: 30S ribosomal protein S11 [Candidatus Kerfeldbacteria bacterium CG_4_9_14_3_um_filter_45_8]
MSEEIVKKEEEKKVAIPAATDVVEDKEDDDADATTAPAKKKKSKKRHVPRGKVYIAATYNNTIVTFCDPQGNALSQCSAGRVGFKGPKKSTPYAAGIIVKVASEKVKDMGMKEIDVVVKGIGSGRDGAIRALNAQGFHLATIEDLTPMPHNGCRPKKARRV